MTYYLPFDSQSPSPGLRPIHISKAPDFDSAHLAKQPPIGGTPSLCKTFKSYLPGEAKAGQLSECLSTPETHKDTQYIHNCSVNCSHSMSTIRNEYHF